MTRSAKFGWIAVALNCVVSGSWTIWGAIENFHEGWFSKTLFANLLLSLLYLSGAILWTLLGVVAIKWPRIGSIGVIFTGIAFGIFILKILTHFTLPAFLSWLPFMGAFGLIGVLWWFGSPEPKKWAIVLSIGLPLLVFVICAAEPVYRISQRFDDGYRGARVIKGNGVELVWAQEGPGWPDKGVGYLEAVKRCKMLTVDGETLAATPQNIWRLPTVDEVARSMTRKGQNSGGYWDPARNDTEFKIMPDKEAPLWNPYTGIIYWWTSSENAQGKICRMVFDGNVGPLAKNFKMDSLGFRAVRDVRPGDERLPVFAR